MLSREDYKSYFDQMMRIEISARDAYQECVDKAEYADVKKICGRILRDEKRHILIVKEIIRLLIS